MNFNISKFLIIFFIALIYVQGQEPVVSNIEFIGHDRTKEYILEREIQHPINAPLDSSLAEEDKQRLENLGIFSLVDLQVFKRTDNNVVIRYTIIESWRYFPMLTPIYDEKWGWSVGAMLMISNFRGRNESLALQGQYGSQNTIGLEYVNPWITGDHVSLRVSLGNDLYNHTFLPYDIESKHIQISLGKYLNQSLRAKVGFSLIDKKYSNDLEDNKYFNLIPFTSIRYDTRDLYANPSKGLIHKNSLYSRIDLNGDKYHQLLWNQSTSIFHELIDGKRNMVIGANIESRFSFSKNLDIWYDYLGGAYSVRGWNVPSNQLFTNSDQSYRFGMNWITTSFEIRQTIIPKFVTQFDNEFGLSIAAYTDIGVVDNNISNLVKQSPMFGAGVGLRIPWPIIKSIRLDYGWSFYKGKYVEQSLHFSFGEKF